MPKVVKAKYRKRFLQLSWVAKKDSVGDYIITGIPARICIGLSNVSYCIIFWVTGDYSVTGTPDSISLGTFATLPR